MVISDHLLVSFWVCAWCSHILVERTATIFRVTESGSGGYWRIFGQLEFGEV
jgi:hypothetical protein